MDKPDIELELTRNKDGMIAKLAYKNNIDTKESALEFCAIIESIFGVSNCGEEMPELVQPEINQN